MPANQNAPVEDRSNQELVFTRLFDTPRELVWKAWTDPKHLVHWWGPKGFTNTFQEISVKPGGIWRFIMHGPDGHDYPNKIVYKEIVKPDRLTYSHSGEEGELVQFHATETFAEHGAKTKLTMGLVFPSAAGRDRAVKEYHADEGGNQTLDRLAEYLTQM